MPSRGRYGVSSFLFFFYCSVLLIFLLLSFFFSYLLFFVELFCVHVNSLLLDVKGFHVF